MITNRSFITTCAYNENPIYLQSKNQNEGISFFLLHWPNMKERYCTVISSSFFIEVWARSVSLLLVGSTLQHLWHRKHNNSPLNELMKVQNSFDILGLVSFYSKKLDYCNKGNNFFQESIIPSHQCYLYLALEMQECERNENVGKTALPPTLCFFITGS